jgi:glycosyltransferase involved in cell wall biosynthesis
MTALRVLCLDIEGGFGGSSRSLYESLKHMDRSQVAPEVWCRRDGPVRQRYETLGIPCRLMVDMPRFVAVPNWPGNLVDFLNFALHWRKASGFRNALAESSARFDLIHFNHEGLTLLMRHLRKRIPDIPMTMHIRTYIPEHVFSRWQSRLAVQNADRLAFITENERNWTARYSGAEPRGTVIYNIAEPPPAIAPSASVPRDTRLKVAVLSNYDYVRGIDRVVDVAACLATRGRRDILFVMAGDMKLRGSLPGELGRIGRSGGTLADYAGSRGVADMFLFLGHVSAPEPVLTACDLLLKPTREHNPWGRDILEAMSQGKPVISVGHYERFVETDKTGVLMPVYSDEALADHLVRLDGDRAQLQRLGAMARGRVAELCNGPGRAADLLNLWHEAVRTRLAA